MPYDIIIVGGSFAGLAAATQIARARRRVLVIDAGLPRNRFAEHSHGFLGQDGRAPAEILGDARRQLLAYPTAKIVDGLADKAEATDFGLRIGIDSGETFEASRLILATGVRDTLPDIPGLAEQWGKTVLHCPYCHGYEVAIGALGVLATGPMAIHQAQMIADWGDVTLFTNGIFVPNAEQLQALKARNVTVEPASVIRVEGDSASGLLLRLDDGSTQKIKALFTAPRTCMVSPLAEQLGCEFVDGFFGPVIKVDERQQTTVQGVYAAGDAAREPHNVAFAVANGTWAGVAAHQSLIFG
ncbi:NAD(P)/FAD-dependent oxidoreductase [Mesorhizobium sp. DCY119]|uniref:NAD(P)/FAD-dependent oxidoreductase n=1 Tax=Mesorhizobium sp. DCY119 TaxID=2108445 RepID=UPI000E6C5112|nr:NAD(P)/FAD-dependent oxidoreductase [Mesorhizobium sp. DCY119]RJG46717.1 NAD(P)/FAD-dependent oxidoreductase [Mesorhizobium sp. DCY119]